jgi:PAS domain S-box-containing protein
MVVLVENNFSKIMDEFENLKKVQLIFHKILEITADGFLIVDDNGKIIEINKAYCNFLAVNRKDLIGKYVLDIIKNSKLPEILVKGQTEVDVVHKLAEGQSPAKEKFVAVTRAPVKEDDKVIAAVGQVKFSRETFELAEKLQHMDSELQYYKDELKRIVGSKYSFDSMIGRSPIFRQTVELAQRAAASDFNVLITGETGTGKEVFANAVHYASPRRLKPFIRINCAAIPSELLESELFGYEEGSFTGAKKGGKKGKFELANGGTIFLDEIGDMPLSMQVKLLRVLQEKEVERVGSDRPIPIDVRVIAATNQNLEERVKTKAFRSDLYYRLNVIQIRIPALRERVDDIGLFIDYFLQDLNERYGTEYSISQDTKQLLQGCEWPGNVRELKNIVERAYSMVDNGIILNQHLPANIISTSHISKLDNHSQNLELLMEQIEKEIILSVIKKNDYNFRSTARELGIHRSTLYKKFNKLGIDTMNLRSS